MSAARKLSWKAVRRGEIYCAPACGGRTAWGCTWKEYLKAKSRARKLAKHMNSGPYAKLRWRIHVHENLGWHFSVYSACGRARVTAFIHNGKIDSYTGWVDDDVVHGGARFVAHGKTPAGALRGAIVKARAAFANMAGIVKGL